MDDATRDALNENSSLCWVYNEIAVCCDSATDQSEKKTSYITRNDWSVAESQ